MEQPGTRPHRSRKRDCLVVYQRAACRLGRGGRARRVSFAPPADAPRAACQTAHARMQPPRLVCRSVRITAGRGGYGRASEETGWNIVLARGDSATA